MSISIDFKNSTCPDSFRDDLEDALRLICPSAEVVVDSVDGGGRPEQGHVDVNLDTLCFLKYCAHRAGCNLLLDLVDPSSAVIVIVEYKDPQYSSQYLTVSWCPPSSLWWAESEECCDGEDCVGCGTHSHPPAAFLAHELIHAWHDEKGTYRFPGKINAGAKPEEICTIQAENQIRAEMCVVPRCRYTPFHPCIQFPSETNLGGWEQGQGSGEYICLLLDTKADRMSCGCGPALRRCPIAGIREILCWVRTRAMWLLGRHHAPSQMPADWLAECRYAELLERFLGSPSDQERLEEMESAARLVVWSRERQATRVVQEALEESEDAFLLESVSMHGAYTVIAFYHAPSGSSLLTNLPVRTEGRPGSTHAPASLRRYELSGPQSQEALGLLEEGPVGSFPPGIGGHFGAADGGAEFLTVKRGGEVRQMAARNLGFRVYLDRRENRADENSEDAVRWEAVRRIWEWGTRMVGETRTSERPSGEKR